MNNTKVVPFLKWAGGKRWFVQNHATILPRHYRRYIEPFLGGGSVFFHLQPAHAVLGDINPEVIAAYDGIRLDWRRIRSSLAYRQRAHDADDEYYYRLRARVPSNPLEVASRMIYLNRTCFNGIYRVNRQGQFNVPRGTKDSVLRETDDFEAIAGLLKRAELRVADFEQLIDEAEKGDLVFADPPYTVRHNYNGFVKYNEVLFHWRDQERLAMALRRARKRGAKVVCTNANHDSVRDLYEGHGFELRVVKRPSAVSADVDSRRQFEELIILANTQDVLHRADPE